MLRFSLTAYLMAATVLGPAVCCCTVSQFAPGGGCCAAPLVKRRPHRQQHCGHHQHRAGRAAQSPNAPPTCPHDQCPCERHNGPQFALVERGESSDCTLNVFRSISIAIAATFDAPAMTQPGGSSIEQHALDSAVLSGRDLLRALHILRC